MPREQQQSNLAVKFILYALFPAFVSLFAAFWYFWNKSTDTTSALPSECDAFNFTGNRSITNYSIMVIGEVHIKKYFTHLCLSAIAKLFWHQNITIHWELTPDEMQPWLASTEDVLPRQLCATYTCLGWEDPKARDITEEFTRNLRTSWYLAILDNHLSAGIKNTGQKLKAHINNNKQQLIQHICNTPGMQNIVAQFGLNTIHAEAFQLLSLMGRSISQGASSLDDIARFFCEKMQTKYKIPINTKTIESCMQDMGTKVYRHVDSERDNVLHNAIRNARNRRDTFTIFHMGDKHAQEMQRRPENNDIAFVRTKEGVQL